MGLAQAVEPAKELLELLGTAPATGTCSSDIVRLTYSTKSFLRELGRNKMKSSYLDSRCKGLERIFIENKVPFATKENWQFL